MSKTGIRVKDNQGNYLPFEDIKNQWFYIDDQWSVPEDRPTVIRNVMSVYREVFGHMVAIHRLGSYPLWLAVAETVFYLPNFFRMKVLMSPASFNNKLTESLITNIEPYVGESRILPMKVPKLSYFYRGFLTTSIPYTVSNWTIRIAIFRQLNLNWEGKNAMTNFASNFGFGFASGAISSLITVPLYKLYLWNHYLQSLGKTDASFKTIYDSAFIETQYAHTKKSILRRFQVLYRYTGLITLRGGVQGITSLGTYNYLYENSTVHKFEPLNNFIVSTNPVLDKLAKIGYFNIKSLDDRPEYMQIMKAAIFAGLFTGIVMSFWDFYMSQMIKNAIVNKDKRIKFKKELANLRSQKLFGKNILFLLMANSMRYFGLIFSWNMYEKYLFK